MTLERKAHPTMAVPYARPVLRPPLQNLDLRNPQFRPDSYDSAEFPHWLPYDGRRNAECR